MKEKNNIPQYQLEQYTKAHREDVSISNFAYNNIDAALKINSFELYSTEGLRERIGPLKSFFYRLGFTLSGNVSVDLGLEKYRHSKGTINITSINQIFSLYNVSQDFFGYYMLFTPAFILEASALSKQLEDDYPFFNPSGMHFLLLSDEELNNAVLFIQKMNEEIHQNKANKVQAIKMYLHLLLLECKRSYDRQQLSTFKGFTESNMLVTKFKKLVAQHFLTKKHVADYADMLAVTANHLNKVIKENTGLTALESIYEMILLEAKTQLMHTDTTVAEIAYQLEFSDPASFNRFFKRSAGITPLEFRQKA